MTPRAVLCCIAGVLAVASTPGCHTNLKKRDLDPQVLLNAYTKSVDEARARAEAEASKGIRKLEAAPGRDGQFAVSVDLEHASLDGAVKRVLEAAHAAYVLRTNLRGTVTARFEEVPFLEAVNLLLSAHGYRASLEGRVLVIDLAPAPPDAVEAAPSGGGASFPSGEGPPPSFGGAPSAPAATVEASFPLRWLGAEDAKALLTGLHPPSQSGQPPTLRFAAEPGNNTVFMMGPADEVRRTTKALSRADREPPHVLIETLFVEIDQEYFNRFSLNFQDIAFKRYSGINLFLGLLHAKGVTFTSTEGADNATTFTALLDALETEELARIVSRPYIATVSGQQATLKIVRDRIVIAQTSQINSTSYEVSSGVNMNITPTVTAEGLIRVDVDVEDSQFVPSTQNVSVERDRNTARTTMLVDDGHSIVIGGLALERRTHSTGGVPGLHRVHGLDLIFGDQSATSLKHEVIVVVTPHVYTPGSVPPVGSMEPIYGSTLPSAAPRHAAASR